MPMLRAVLALLILQWCHMLKLSMMSGSRPYTAVMIVPTGIGAKIGGYAGDALPSAKLLASVVDVLITHPNVMNGAMLYWPMDNVLYAEGFALDEFSAGRIGLQRLKKQGNKIGLLLDKGIEKDLMLRHIQVADAYRATLGINVKDCVVTRENVGVNVDVSKISGASWGSLHNPDTLLEGARELVANGCDAIAVVARFPEDEELDGDGSDDLAAETFDSYRKGDGVDGIAGAEALISHVITKNLMVPCAHAPAFEAMGVEEGVSPKAVAEELGYTFLPCVLSYLHRAPRLVELKNRREIGNDPIQHRHDDLVTADDVDAVVVPYSALGGPAVLSLLARQKLVIAVEENESAMKVTSDVLLLKKDFMDVASGRRIEYNIVHARSYAEAAGLLAAHKSGIMLESVSSVVPRLPVRYL